jgi:hypothetical protein
MTTPIAERVPGNLGSALADYPWSAPLEDVKLKPK